MATATRNRRAHIGRRVRGGGVGGQLAALFMLGQARRSQAVALAAVENVMLPTRVSLGFSTIALLLTAAPALAWPGGWGSAGPYGYGYPGRGSDPREGKVDAAHFVAS